MAFDEEANLCRELVPRVRAFALRRTHDPALSADVAQEVAMIVVLSLRDGKVEDPSRLGAFVLGVAKNVIGSIRRGERRRTALLERLGPTFERVTAIEETRADRAKVEDCFAKLTPRAQTVLLLTFYADRSADEIATELGASPGNVRVLRHRALAQLHACVGAAE